MTSKNLFSVSARENHKRRIWVWIVSILINLALYPGILVVYLSRIKFQHESGAYATDALYQKALQDAGADAFGFQPLCVAPVILLGILIAVQGFSYLYDRRKVDMYHSVPVPAKRRFIVIYTNGLLMYFASAIGSILLALLIAVTQGAVNGRGLAECGLAFLMNTIAFLVVYHISILSVMLTGNIVITGFAVMVFLLIGTVAENLVHLMKYTFFNTADYFFTDSTVKIDFVEKYYSGLQSLRRIKELSESTQTLLPFYIAGVLAALLLLAVSYWCYRKRPAEAVGKSIAFRQIKPFIKVIISVLAGVACCYLVYEATYYNIPVTLLGMVIGTVLCCGIMESLYEFDIRAAIRHLASTGIAVVAVVLVFCFYYFDWSGYDSYVPDAEDVESVAMDMGPYYQYCEWSEETGGVMHLNSNDYMREHMFLKDADAVCQLAAKYQAVTDRKHSGLFAADMQDARGVNVLYRLKSGREVSRQFLIDFADSSNEELLNRIVGTKEYRESSYAMIYDEDFVSTMQKQFRVSYTNGAIECELPASEIEALRQAWIADMESCDFSLLRNNRPCGKLEWSLKTHYLSWEVPVYESFTNTIAYLEEHNAYYPLKLQAEDIANLSITNYHLDEQKKAEELLESGAEAAAIDYEYSARGDYSRSATFEDLAEIEKIIEDIYPTSLEMYWNDTEQDIDSNYAITITFKPSIEYPYDMGYHYYHFKSGKVPDFVAERTAYTAE
ncbi:MAG: hypothetical protein NC419_05115 [Muribaculaceae bacterium]|nr:hypothetical protein [Muribaculaceae bacterium]